MPPTNDSFATPTVLTGTSGSASGTNVGATFETGEPSQPWADNGEVSVWYRWVAPADRSLTIDLSGSTFDTTLDVFTGPTVDALTEVGHDDDSGSGTTSKLTVYVEGGVTYHIRVNGYDSTETGDIELAWSTVKVCAFPAHATYLPDDYPGYSYNWTALDGDSHLYASRFETATSDHRIHRYDYPTLDNQTEIADLPSGTTDLRGLAALGSYLYWIRRTSTNVYVEKVALSGGTVVTIIDEDADTAGVYNFWKRIVANPVNNRLYALRDQAEGTIGGETGPVTSDLIEINPAGPTTTIVYTISGTPGDPFYVGRRLLFEALTVDSAGGVWGHGYSGGNGVIWLYEPATDTFEWATGIAFGDDHIIALSEGQFIGTGRGTLIIGFADGTTEIQHDFDYTHWTCQALLAGDDDGFYSPTFDVIGWVRSNNAVWQLQLPSVGGWGVGMVRMGASA